MAAIVQTNFTATATNSLATGLRDIKPPMEIPGGWAWLWWVLAAMVVAALVVGLVMFLIKRRKHMPAPPPIPPHVVAKEQLENALKLLSQPKPFVIAVSDALRGYLEARFSFRAPERTTEEFLHELQSAPQLDTTQKNGLGDFLQHCDLVKFAKYEPTEKELRNLHSAAYRLVEETEPRPEPPPGSDETPGRPDALNRKS